MTATVAQISTRHSWDKLPRMDDPSRHVYTCRRCELKKRSEPSGRGWVELWLAADGSKGEGKVPPCPGPREPSEPTSLAVDLAPVPGAPATARPCCHHVPPLGLCGLPTHPYPDGDLCDPASAAVSTSRAEGLRELRSATSGMGVPTWRGEVA